MGTTVAPEPPPGSTAPWLSRCLNVPRLRKHRGAHGAVHALLSVSSASSTRPVMHSWYTMDSIGVAPMPPATRTTLENLWVQSHHGPQARMSARTGGTHNQVRKSHNSVGNLRLLDNEVLAVHGSRQVVRSTAAVSIGAVARLHSGLRVKVVRQAAPKGTIHPDVAWQLPCTHQLQQSVGPRTCENIAQSPALGRLPKVVERQLQCCTT